MKKAIIILIIINLSLLNYVMFLDYRHMTIQLEQTRQELINSKTLNSIRELKHRETYLKLM